MNPSRKPRSRSLAALAVTAAIVLSAALPAPLFPQAPAFRVPGSRAELEQALTSQAATVRGRVGILVKHVESGESFGLREDERFQLASVFKIPVLLTLYKQISLGRISLDDRIMFEERMKTFGSGLMASMKPGLNISVQDLQLLMMARSDNTATDILFRLVTPQAIAVTMAELGLVATTVDYDTRQLILAYLGLDPGKPLTLAELDGASGVGLGGQVPPGRREGFRDVDPQYLDAPRDRPSPGEVRQGRDRRPGRRATGILTTMKEPHRGRAHPALPAGDPPTSPGRAAAWPGTARTPCSWTRPSSGCRTRPELW